jgi:hypothetical protein
MNQGQADDWTRVIAQHASQHRAGGGDSTENVKSDRESGFDGAHSHSVYQGDENRHFGHGNEQPNQHLFQVDPLLSEGIFLGSLPPRIPANEVEEAVVPGSMKRDVAGQGGYGLVFDPTMNTTTNLDEIVNGRGGGQQQLGVAGLEDNFNGNGNGNGIGNDIGALASTEVGPPSDSQITFPDDTNLFADWTFDMGVEGAFDFLADWTGPVQGQGQVGGEGGTNHGQGHGQGHGHGEGQGGGEGEGEGEREGRR